MNNENQIIRKDAKNCFVESLNDTYGIGKIHLNFAAYNMDRPEGKRQTDSVHIYLAADEFLELCRKLCCGELRYMIHMKKKNGDKTPIYQTRRNTGRKTFAHESEAAGWHEPLKNIPALCGHKVGSSVGCGKRTWIGHGKGAHRSEVRG